MKELVFDIDFPNITNPKFLPLMRDRSNYLMMRGGAASSKSKHAAIKILLRMMLEEGHRFLLLRKVYATIRKSQFADIVDFIKDWNLTKFFKINKTDLTITFIPNGNEIIAAGLDEREKLKSISGVTGEWIEEITELELQDFLQADLRLRGETRHYPQIIGSFNPIDSSHWIKDFFFPFEIDSQLEQKGLITYNKEVELEDGEIDSLSVTVHHSTYLDNNFLGKKDKAKLNALKKSDVQYYNIYCLGHWGSIGHLVYPRDLFQIVDEFPEEFDEVGYGLDFGFVHPTVLLKVGIKNFDIEGAEEIERRYYIEELVYESGLHNKKLIEKMREFNISPDDPIYADHQAADKIDELNEVTDKDGKPLFNVLKADKSVQDGIDFVRRCKIFTKRTNVGFNKEIPRYRRKLGKDGKPLEEVVKENDDGMDAFRYFVYTHSKSFQELHIYIKN